jgi:hypothetical protein
VKKLSFAIATLGSVLFAGSAFAAGEADAAPENQAHFVGTLQRADVQALLASQQQRGELFRTGEAMDNTYGVAPITGDRTLDAVRAEAVATAHAPNQNLDRKAFVNSEVPRAYTIGSSEAAHQASVDSGIHRK